MNFKGCVDEVWIYERKLSFGEVVFVYGYFLIVDLLVGLLDVWLDDECFFVWGYYFGSVDELY